MTLTAPRIDHLLVSTDGAAPARWIETFSNGQICRNDHLPSARPGLIWVWLDLGVEPSEVMEPIKQHFGIDVPIAVMSRIPSPVEAVKALQQGAKAYLNAHALPVVLQRVHDTVSSGAVWLGADLVDFLSAALHVDASTTPSESSQSWRSQLTDREAQVAEMIGRGLSNKLVARQMKITERTVKGHLTSIFTKLNVTDRLMLALIVSGRSN